MKFSELLNIAALKSDTVKDFTVSGLAYDSRKVKDGFIFFAIKGYKEDGNKYAMKAIEDGAKAIITDFISAKEFIGEVSGEINVIGVDDVRKVMAQMAFTFYGNPSEKIKLIGVTGTNGKTTITYLLKHIFEIAGFKCGLIGTIDYLTGASKQESRLTTPDSVEINIMLKEMVDAGIEYCFMEVSSIALVLHRVYGQKFSAGVFTNLTSEHLDLHKNMQNYFEAKKILFDYLDESHFAVTNADDEYGYDMIKNTKGQKIFYAMKSDTDYKAINEKISMEGLSFDILCKDGIYNINTKLTGRFNIYNILAAVSLARSMNINFETIQKAISGFGAVNGRFNKIELPNKAFAVIDYSHTSDSLKNAVESAIEIRNMSATKGRVITIFGCGGNKDKTKRPVMGEIATSLSDYSIITSDNPRFEEPMDIINEILKGVKTKNNFEINANREQAIKRGIEISNSGDIILICGKGHETYQEVKGVKSHFDDKEMVGKYIHLAK
ncbi:MAG: UDP-N-acetylmuramoyl-L-alanyl-D-glutamate--2,6-diaminopimelate ligase [Ignavibacteriae bacterium]|nr:UDP-N-acetylmuramoyl-L-alanyl-D-glutamate--2,6-diaminopimelate ligase [Ignavibacteriota bacterium]